VGNRETNILSLINPWLNINYQIKTKNGTVTKFSNFAELNEASVHKIYLLPASSGHVRQLRIRPAPTLVAKPLFSLVLWQSNSLHWASSTKKIENWKPKVAIHYHYQLLQPIVILSLSHLNTIQHKCEARTWHVVTTSDKTLAIKNNPHLTLNRAKINRFYFKIILVLVSYIYIQNELRY